MRASWFLPGLSLCALCLAAQAPIALHAPIQKVRLHPDEAWVTRVGRVQLPGAGMHRLRLEGLPPGLRLEDLQVTAKGPAGSRLGDLALSSDARAVTETPEWKALEAEREGLRERRGGLESASGAGQEGLAFLEGLQATYDKELSARLALAAPSATAVLELSRGVQGRLGELLAAERKRRRELEKLAREEARLDAELRKRAGERRNAPSRVLVEFGTPAAGVAEVALAYRTRSARWTPLYEARLSEDRARLELALYASVVQRTGEAWEGVDLEISNARPSRSLAVPAYTEGQEVNWWRPGGVIKKTVGIDLRDEMEAPAPAQNFVSERIAPMAPPPPPPPPAAAREATASVLEEASGLAATFRVEGSKDVPSDGEPHRFKVQVRELAPSLSLFATPRLDPTAYLMARFTAPSGLPLFPGAPVLRFAGNQRLGEAPLEIPAAGQPFSLGFGPYKSLRVSFVKVDRRQEEVGTFTKERQWTVRERIELAQDGPEVLELEVQDRMLKPASDQVKVSLLPDFSSGWTEARPGVRSWKLKVAPGETRRLELGLAVRAPKEGVVTGLED